MQISSLVGARITGLWTAHFLKQLDASLDIAIVEQGVAGYGGTGRNAGIVGACIDHSHALATRSLWQRRSSTNGAAGIAKR